nr:hypothetical protein [Tanacetum cinerariifolium]
MSSLELCILISRASKLWKEIVEDKYFRFVIQIDEGKEDMCSVYVEKEGEILRLRGEAEHEMKEFSKPTKVLSCVDDVMLVQELVEKRLFVVHQVIKNKRFEVRVALKGEDDSFGLVHTGKDIDEGFSDHACLSNVAKTQGQGVFTTKYCLENPTEKPSLFFLAVPKVIFGGRYVILLGGKQGLSTMLFGFVDEKCARPRRRYSYYKRPEFYEGISQVLSSFK